MDRSTSELGARPAERPGAARASRQRPLRGGRRGQRGQTLVIFAISITVLVGFVGLSIDALRAYDLYAREQRAAEAGALAAVTYMPCWYSSSAGAAGCAGTSPDGNSAISRALVEVRKNGFGATATANSACSGVQTTQEVMTCTVSGDAYAVRVTITEPTTVVLLGVVGVQSFNVTATGAAEYLPSTILGTNPTDLGANIWGYGDSAQPKGFLPAINGPAELQESGDPYVNCEQYNSQGNPREDITMNLVPPLGWPDGNPHTTTDFSTNHLNNPNDATHCGAGSDDQQPTGFTGLAGDGTTLHEAYNYYINVTQSGATFYIWNPSFDPGPPQSNCTNGSQGPAPDMFLQDVGCTSYYEKYGPLTAQTGGKGGTPVFDDPRFYFNVTYTLYAISNQFAPAGTQVATKTFRPYDYYSSDTSGHCSGSAYDLDGTSSYQAGGPSGGTCTGDPNYGAWSTWTAIDTGTYRLAVVTSSYGATLGGDDGTGCGLFTCGWGRHTYSLAVCTGAPPVGTGSGNTGSSCNSGGTITSWNNMDTYFNFPGGAGNPVSLPAASLPASYAGRTIDFSFYNPGVSHGNTNNLYLAIVPPDCTQVTIPVYAGPPQDNNWYRSTTSPGQPPDAKCASQNTWQWLWTSKDDDAIYHGLWVTIPVQLSSTYAGGSWFVDIQSDHKDFNQMAMSVTLAGGGSPIHLIQ